MYSPCPTVHVSTRLSATFCHGFALVASSLIVVLMLYYTRLPKFPSGPKGLPVLGMSRNHPKQEYWKTYMQWGKQYGKNGILSFHLWGRRIVVLNSFQAATDLLVNRSAMYSDRPCPTMQTLMHRNKSIFMSKQGDRLKRYRKMMHQQFNLNVSKKYWSFQESESLVLLQNLIAAPQNLDKSLRKNAAATIMKVTFGIHVQDCDDFFVRTAEESMRVASLATAPGRWLVDSFPILRHIPSWFPGAGFQSKAQTWGKLLYQQSRIPHEFVKQEMSRGAAEPSFTSDFLESMTTPEDEDILLWAAGALYVGGSDTTVTVIKSFVYLMTLHPEIQHKVQQELDEVVGKNRLPTIADRPYLPYLNNVIKEVMRWSPSAPMGLPRCPSQDDVYLGYDIPKGTTIIPNIWAMLHDESVYPKPDVFNPDRYDPKVTQPVQPEPDLVFGLVRRSCPGRHFAESSVFIQIASIASAFYLDKVRDANGNEITPVAEFTTGLVSCLKSFPYALRVRSPEVSTYLQSSVSNLYLNGLA